MAFTAPSSVSTLAFNAILAAVAGTFLVGHVAADKALGRSPAEAVRRLGLVATGLLAFVGLAAFASTRLEAAPMPRLMAFFLASNFVVLTAALSPLGRTYARGLPLGALVAFQAFRLPLELVLHAWAQQGSIPATMTWNGLNLDILSGAAALALAPWCARWRGAAWIFNVLGLGLLLNVARVAVMSSPLPFAWGVQPPLQLAFHLPYALIVPICVGGALFGHLVLTRALLDPPRA
jgi:hypothetical protein